LLPDLRNSLLLKQNFIKFPLIKIKVLHSLYVLTVCKYHYMKSLLKCPLVLLAFLPILAIAQMPSLVIPEEKGVVYNREFGVDMRVNTNGLSLGFTKGIIKTFYRSSTYYFDLTFYRDLKENRQNNKVIFAPTNETSNAFVYGKINSLYSIRAGKGIKKYWSDKASRKGALVGYILEGGITLGILQPYYIKVANLNEDTGLPELKEVKYGEKDNALFLDNARIFGRSSLFKGIFESALIPGVHAQAGIHCDFGKYDNFIRAVEVGAMANVFTQSVRLMVNQPARPYMLNFYLAFQLGKRD